MLKKFIVYLLMAVLVVGAAIYILDLADDAMAVRILRQGTSENQLISFNADSDYVRVANKIDGFKLPAYHWAVKKWRRQGLLFYLSQESLLKTVVFTQGGKKAEVVYFSSENFSPRPKRGTLMRVTIYTGVPEDVTGVNVSPNMLSARDKGKSGIVYTDNQLNYKQLDMFDRGVLVPELITFIQE